MFTYIYTHVYVYMHSVYVCVHVSSPVTHSMDCLLPIIGHCLPYTPQTTYET